MRIISSVLLLCLGLNGCFAYMPSRGGALRQGQGVRAWLNAPMDVRLAEVTANNVSEIEGEVVRADSAVLVLSARMIRSSSGYEQLGANATVQIPRANVARLEERRISVLRSAGLVGIAVALTVVTAAANLGSGAKGGDGRGPGGEQ